MMKLSYSKPEPKNEERLIAEPGRELEAEEKPAFEPLDAAASYRKEEGRQSPALFFVVVGGEKKEQQYLTEFLKKRHHWKLKIIVVASKPKAGGLSPRMMREALAVRLAEISEIDSVYMITDVDHYYGELCAILKGDKLCGESWVISNPAFEIWLYFCYFNHPEADLCCVRNAQPSKRSAALKMRLNELKEGGIDPRKAFEFTNDGIVNSGRNYREDGNGIPELFSTQMHLFASDMINALGEDYDKWKREKQAAAASFMKKLRPKA